MQDNLLKLTKLKEDNPDEYKNVVAELEAMKSRFEKNEEVEELNDDDIEDVVGGTLVGALYGGGIKDLFDNNGIFKKGADGAADMAEHPNSSPLAKKALYDVRDIGNLWSWIM